MFEAIFAGVLLLVVAIGGTIAPTKQPYSCRQYDEAQQNCRTYENCDHRGPDQQRRECLYGDKLGASEKH
jgi:hypothetical protein